ncbi:gamma-glutamyltransferase [Halopseudomonas pelagia]|uniref:gamma-glutamyltransferase n=1 Tax=Halopseudomonas pelagia TaxID=553151 RepID=UPI0030DCA76F|tara:strand:- start:2167 stop:3912 length:1746 start_codon:yes stop_codon:yes gene_type:complete
MFRPQLQAPSLLLLCALLFAPLAQAKTQTPDQQAVASAHPAATAAGHRILDQGGNAFDAAVSVAATLAVVEPYSSGLGGGGFFLLRQQREAGVEYHFLDARETAPLAADRDFYQDAEGQFQRDPALNGPQAAGIPGLPAALVLLAEEYGNLSLKQSLQPAIDAAEQGFGVTERYRMLGDFRLEAMRRNAETTRLFLRDGEIPAVGTLIHQAELAETLRALAERGQAGFYQGPVAKRLLDAVQAGGGVWQQADLDNYRVVERQPVSFNSFGMRVISSPLPSAGGIALANLLQGLEVLPRATPGSAAWTHQLVELMRRSYRERMLLGDSDFVEVPTAKLLSAEHARAMASSIDPRKATPSTELGEPAPFNEGTDTTHFSLIDSQGNAVAATLSINLPFGAAFTVPGTGVLLNNEMDDFATDPTGENAYQLAGSEPNSVGPGKRPLSSMTPTMLENEEQLAVLGTPGGSRIITMVLLGALEAIEGEKVESWVSRPRFHHQYLPDHIQIEDGAFNPEVQGELEALGHTIKPVGRDYGDMHAVHWNKQTGELRAASDPRGVGQALIKRNAGQQTQRRSEPRAVTAD